MADTGNRDRAGRTANARDRQENLRARRANDTGAAALLADAPMQRGKGGARKGARMADGMEGAGMTARLQALLKGADGAERRQSLMRAMRILTDTPDDGTGFVEGTPFSVAGVKKLVNTLESRSKGKGASGAGVAGKAMAFLTKADNSQASETVHGVQVKRLLQLAKLGDRMKARPGKGA